MSLDSSEEDRVEQVLRGAVTSVDEALLKVTGAAENDQEDFLKQNFETLDQNCSTGTRRQTLTLKGYLGVLGQYRSEDKCQISVH